MVQLRTHCPLLPLQRFGLASAPPQNRHSQRQSVHWRVSSSKADDLAALQNFKSGLDKALANALEEAAAEAKAPPPPSDNEKDLAEIEGSSFWSVIKSLPTSQLALVLCYTNSCVPCKAAKPQISEWVEASGGKVAAYKFQLSLPNKEVALGMGVNSSPQFLFFKNGELIEKFRGGNSLPQVKEYFDANI